MREFLAILYVLSAALPIIGLFRLLVLARRESADIQKAEQSASGNGASYGQVKVLLPALVQASIGRPKAVVRDLMLIGIGIVAGTVASIWSLYLP